MNEVYHDVDGYAPGPGKRTERGEYSNWALPTCLHLLVHGEFAPFIRSYSIPSVNHGCKFSASRSTRDEGDKRDGLCIERLELTTRARSLGHTRKKAESMFGLISEREAMMLQ